MSNKRGPVQSLSKLDQILSQNELPNEISGNKYFTTDSGLVGKEVIIKFNDPSACGGFLTRAKIAFPLPESLGQPAVVVFNQQSWSGGDNSFVESIAKTFKTTEFSASSFGPAVSKIGSPGEKNIKVFLPNSSICYEAGYPPELSATTNGVPQGSALFNDSNNQWVVSIDNSLLGNVGDVTNQQAQQFGSAPKIQNFSTAAGLKGKEIISSNSGEILLPLVQNYQSGDTLITSIYWKNSGYQKNAEMIARSLNVNLSCR